MLWVAGRAPGRPCQLPEHGHRIVDADEITVHVTGLVTNPLQGQVGDVGHLTGSGASPVALVTGRGRGIGRAIAIDLAAAGCRLAVNQAGTADCPARQLFLSSMMRRIFPADRSMPPGSRTLTATVTPM